MHYLVADFPAGDLAAHRLNHASALAAGDEGQLGLELVLALNDEDVGEVQPRGLYIQPHIIGTQLRYRPVVTQIELVGQSMLPAYHRDRHDQ